MTPSAAAEASRVHRNLVLRGEPAAPGIAVAKALPFERLAVPVFRIGVRRRAVSHEIVRFRAAQAQAIEQVRRIRESTTEALGGDRAFLFEAQRLMLEDPLLVNRVEEVIASDRVNAEWAVRTVLRELESLFDGLADDYLRQRRGDIEDVGGRLLRNLSGTGAARPRVPLPGRRIVAAVDLLPSDTALLDWSRTAGLAMEAGGPTYHTAILARSQDVPCVTGARDLMRHLTPGVELVLDGSEGLVVVDPAPETVARYRTKRNRRRARLRRLRAASDRPTTRDDARVTLMANLDEPDEIRFVAENGAEGVGLFRTEHLAVGEIPGEETQYRIYRDLAAAVEPHPFVIRAFDLDVSSVGWAPERNPALGLRGVRLLLEAASAIFETQIRAALRAAVHGNVQLMFPMVGGLEEFRAARTHVTAAIRALRHREERFREVPLGAMLEVPSAAATADILVREAEFLSIGTNDLMQYLFGADRANQRVARFSDQFHPALLRTIRFAARATSRSGVPLAVCGEVAAEPLVIPLLLGFGLRTFSMSPHSIPEVKRTIASLDTKEAEELAQESVQLTTARRVRARVLKRTRPAKTRR